MKKFLLPFVIAIVALTGHVAPINADAAYFMDHKTTYMCTANNLAIADTLRSDYMSDAKFGEKAKLMQNDTFIGYPGGACGFVSTQESCEPNSNFNFLKLYYCSFS